MSNKSWRCRFGLHKYVFMWNEDNQRHRRCRRCGKDKAGSVNPLLDRFMDIGGAGGGGGG